MSNIPVWEPTPPDPEMEQPVSPVVNLAAMTQAILAAAADRLDPDIAMRPITPPVSHYDGRVLEMDAVWCDYCEEWHAVEDLAGPFRGWILTEYTIRHADDSGDHLIIKDELGAEQLWWECPEHTIVLDPNARERMFRCDYCGCWHEDKSDARECCG